MVCTKFDSDKNLPDIIVETQAEFSLNFLSAGSVTVGGFYRYALATLHIIRRFACKLDTSELRTNIFGLVFFVDFSDSD